MSFSAGTTVQPPQPPSLVPQPTSTATTSTSGASTESSETTRVLPSSHTQILTHQEKKQQKMPKRKADSWPNSILNDPDVLSLDDEGRFVLCKVCHVHYAVHGGKKPKPVIMNSGFRTRAWEVHKERTNSHRLEKLIDPRNRTHDALKETSKVQKSRREQQDRIPPPPPPSRTSSQEGARFSPPAPPRLAPHPSAMQRAAPMQRVQSSNPHEHAQSPTQREIRPAQQHARLWTNKHRLPLHQTERLERNAPDRMNRSNANSNHPLPQLSMTLEQMDGLIRWRNMHDDVTRALGSPSLKRPLPNQIRSDEMRSPAWLLAEAEDFSGNNEKVAKKLKSLNAEYDAKILKRPAVCCDRRSETYKEYWGTLRDVYNSGSQAVAPTAVHNEANNKASPSIRKRSEPSDNKESREDSTTRDDTGSSEESAIKPPIVHDQALINAIDRLTGVISKQYSESATTNNTAMMETVDRLSQSIDDMRSNQNEAMGRLIHLHEQKVELMEALLQHKLHKVATSSSNNTKS